MSWEGIDWRGNLAACASGAEKLRHRRHDVESEDLGFRACIAAKLGRDARGIGGGEAVLCSKTLFGRDGGSGGGVSVDLFNPNCNADFVGAGTGALPGLVGAGTAEACLVGSGGLEGRDGGTDLLGTTPGGPVLVL
jgi:hypothetical protein